MAASESNKKRWLAGTAIVMLLGAAAVGAWVWSSLGAITTDDARVKADIVTISAGVPGRISALAKDEGEAVAPGDVMAQLDTRAIALRIQRRKAALDYARSRLQQARREVGAGDGAGRGEEGSNAGLLAETARVREAEAALQELEFRLGIMTLRSPVAGMVVKKNVHRGEFVQPGQPVFMVVDTSRYWVEANVDETEIRFVRPGSKATVRLDSYPGVEFEGEVRGVGGATTSEFSLFSPQKLTGVFIKSTQKLPVKIAVKNAGGRLRVGMLAVVRIEKPDGGQSATPAGVARP